MLRLTEKEEEVMEYIWEIGECAPKDVVAQYDEPRPHVNTIATMFQSLERKGFLTHRSEGRGYRYSAAVEQGEYSKSKLGRFVDKYFKKSYVNLLSQLVDEERLTEEELVEFREIT